MVESGELVTYTLEFKQRPWTTNSERSANRYRRAELVKTWREAFYYLAKQQKIPPMKWISVTVQPFQKMGRLQDVGAANPACKSAIDGLVDAKVLYDDSSEYMRSLTFLPPIRGENALVLIIRGEKQ